MENQLHQNIRKIRNIQRLTQEDMAEKLHISAKAYGKIENGETRLDTDRLTEIAHIFNLKPDELMRFDEKQVFNHCKQKGNYFNSVVHQGFENERKLYDERIAELKEQVAYWKEKSEKK